MTPSREQILQYIRDHPGTSTVAIVEAYEPRDDFTRFTRAHKCISNKLCFLADRGDVRRLYPGNTKEGQCWEVCEGRSS